MNKVVLGVTISFGLVSLLLVAIASGQFGLAKRTNPYATPECGKDVGREIVTANGTWHFGGYECSTKPCIWNWENPFGRCFT